MSIVRMFAAAAVVSVAMSGAALAGEKKDSMAKDEMMKKEEMAKDASMKKDEMAKDAMKK